MLLVLDNCEHVVDAAAELVLGLLGVCPRLVVVATSRQSLGVAGERLVEVGSAGPARRRRCGRRGGLGGGGAVRGAGPGRPPAFPARPSDCDGGGGGLPAAGRAAAGHRAGGRPGPAADGRPDRGAAGRDARSARWGSRRGGTPPHHAGRPGLVVRLARARPSKTLFRRLAVFRSSFILEAAAAVAPAVGGDILTVLGGLVDKSLVAVVDGPGGERRFRLLEPVRQFAAELLQASGERHDAARRHRDHLLSRLPTPGAIPDSAAYERLAAEVDNLRAAVEYAIAASEPEAAIDLILAFWWWWENLGLVDEQLDLLDAALRGRRRGPDAARRSLRSPVAGLDQGDLPGSHR